MPGLGLAGRDSQARGADPRGGAGDDPRQPGPAHGADQEGARRWISKGEGLEELAALRQAHERMLETSRGAASPELSPQAILVDLSLHDFLARGLGNPMLRADYETNRIRIAIFQQRAALCAGTRPLGDGGASGDHRRPATRRCPATTEAIAHHCVRTQHWWGVAES